MTTEESCIRYLIDFLEAQVAYDKLVLDSRAADVAIELDFNWEMVTFQSQADSTRNKLSSFSWNY